MTSSCNNDPYPPVNPLQNLLNMWRPLTDEVPMWPGVHGIPVPGVFGGPVAEPLMVLCGEHDVPGKLKIQLHKLVKFLGHTSNVLMIRSHRMPVGFNTLRPRQNDRHFPDDIFKWIFLNENTWISINISLKLVPTGPINNISTLVQAMAWRRPGDKPLSEPMMVRLPSHGLTDT